jgi:hypothetical protein
MADGQRNSQWHDLYFDLNERAPEANAWAPATTPARCNAKESMMSKNKNVSTVAVTAGMKTRKQAAPSKPKTKLAQLEAMLRRSDGATVEQISKSLAWQTHSVRGAMSGALKKKQGLTITSERMDNGRRVYRIAA